VVEGEKAAAGLEGHGGAAALLPDYVVTTSMGGAKAAHKTDWGPLAGRDVVIWADADEPGAAYAQDVAEAIIAAGAASVRVVDVGDLPKGFDLADEIPEGLDVEARIRSARLIEWPSPEASDSHAYASFGKFEMDAEGLHVGSKESQDSIWISAPFEIAGRARDPQGHDWGRLLRWYDEDRRLHEHFVSDAALQYSRPGSNGGPPDPQFRGSSD
jgi:hypothetical protein